MKRLLISIALLLTAATLFGQVPDTYRTPPSPLTGPTRNNKAVMDANLYVPLSLRIPRASSFTLNGAKDSIGYIMFNTTINRIGIYRGSGVWDTYLSAADTATLVTITYGLGHYYPLSSNPAGYLTSYTGVTSFNGRTGAVVPQLGDYSTYYPTLIGNNAFRGTQTFPDPGDGNSLTLNNAGISVTTNHTGLDAFIITKSDGSQFSFMNLGGYVNQDLNGYTGYGRSGIGYIYGSHNFYIHYPDISGASSNIDIYYPAANGTLALKGDTTSLNLGNTYEVKSNKVTALDNSTVHYPSSNAVKTVTDANAASISNEVTRATTAEAGLVSLTGSYANPSWITSLAQSKITYSGSSTQYVAGNGTLITFPTNNTAFTNGAGYYKSGDSPTFNNLTLTGQLSIPANQIVQSGGYNYFGTSGTQHYFYTAPSGIQFVNHNNTSNIGSISDVGTIAFNSGSIVNAPVNPTDIVRLTELNAEITRATNAEGLKVNYTDTATMLSNVVHKSLSETILGQKTFQNPIVITAQSTTPTTPATGTNIIYGNANGVFSIMGSNGYGLSLAKGHLTASHKVEFQNKDYTVADSTDVASLSLQKVTTVDSNTTHGIYVKTPNKLVTKHKIGVSGDSFSVISPCVGCSGAGQPYMTLLANLLNVTPVIYAVQGATVEKRTPGNINGSTNTMVDQSATYPTYDSSWDWFLLAGGVNDTYQSENSSFNLNNFKADLTTCANALLSKGFPLSKIVIVSPYYIPPSTIVSPTYGTSKILIFQHAAKTVADSMGIKYIDAYDNIAKSGGAIWTNFGDIHPSNEGHAALANYIASCLGYIPYQNKQAAAITGPVQLTNLNLRTTDTLLNASSYYAIMTDTAGKFIRATNPYITNSTDSTRRSGNIFINGFGHIDKTMYVGGTLYVGGNSTLNGAVSIAGSSGYPANKYNLNLVNTGTGSYADSYTNTANTSAPFYINTLSTGQVAIGYGGLSVSGNINSTSGYGSFQKYLQIGGGSGYPASKQYLMATSVGSASYLDAYTGTVNTGAPLNIQTQGGSSLTIGAPTTINSNTTINSWLSLTGSGSYPANKFGIMAIGNTSATYMDFYTNVANTPASFNLGTISNSAITTGTGLFTMNGRLVTAAQNTSRAGFNIAPGGGTDPSTLVNGDIWINSSTLKWYDGSNTHIFAPLDNPAFTGTPTAPTATAGTNTTQVATTAFTTTAVNATNPMTTLGDIIYGGASGVRTRLAGNTSTAQQFLTSTGTGSAAQAPVWFDLFGGANTWTNANTFNSGVTFNAQINTASILMGNSNVLALKGSSGINTVQVAAPSTVTTNRNINLPDNSGTVALTSDLADVVNTSTDANYTITSASQFVKLPIITAARTVSIPSAASYTGRIIRILNQNTSGTFSWSFTGATVKDATGTTLTTLTNQVVYVLESDGTNWNKIN